MKTYKSVDELICDYLDAKRSNYKPSKEVYWSASQLGKCLRHQVLNKLQLPSNDTMPYKWKNNAEDGNASHDWRQKAMELMGALVSQEETIKDEEYRFKGRCDAIVMLNNKMVLVDIKNQNNRGYRRRARLPNKIDDEHKKQLCAYYIFFKKHKYPALEEARMYYINRDTGEREEIIIHFSESFINETLSELKELQKHWVEDKMPKRTTSYFCRLCSFDSICTKLSRKKLSQVHEFIERSLSKEDKGQGDLLQEVSTTQVPKVSSSRAGKPECEPDVTSKPTGSS